MVIKQQERRSEQMPVILSKYEKEILIEMAQKFRGSRSQIIRLALLKFYEQNKNNQLLEDGITN